MWYIMDVELIKNKLDSQEYSFLRLDNRLGGKIEFLTIIGSYGYGTNNNSSDLDIRGVLGNSVNDNEKNFEDTITDTIIYSWPNFINMLANSDLESIEMMGTKQEHVFIQKFSFDLLKQNIDCFLSKNVFYGFYDNIITRLNKIQKITNLTNGIPELEKEYILEKVNYSKLFFKELLYQINKERFIYKIEWTTEYNQKKNLNICIKKMPIVTIVNKDCQINESNYFLLSDDKKIEVFRKQVMHLIRSMMMGIDILQGYGIITYREKDKDFLLDMRSGQLNNREMFDAVNYYSEKFKISYNSSLLKDTISKEHLTELILEIQ